MVISRTAELFGLPVTWGLRSMTAVDHIRPISIRPRGVDLAKGQLTTTHTGSLRVVERSA
jgi:hypothetical protein